MSIVPKWKEFEDKVAQLYRLMGYIVDQNVGILGHQIDLIITYTQPGGIQTKTAVECKYVESGNLAKNDVIDNINALTDLKISQKVAHAIVVTTNGFAKDIWDTAREKEIKLYTFCELEHRIVNFDGYIDGLIRRYDEDEISKYYVPLNGQEEEKSPKEIFPIEDYVYKWINNDKVNHLSVLGEYGTGKTSFCRKLSHDLALKYNEDNLNSRIPILINLRDYSKVMTIRQLITDLLVNEYGIQGINYPLFERMNNDGLFLLIFDGFDEMAQKVVFDVAYTNFSMIADLAKPLQSKVMLTCRVEFFRTHEKEREILLDIDQRRNFDLVYITQFDDKQIKEFLQKRVPLLEISHSTKKGWEYYHRKIQEIFDLSDLAKRPVLLELIVEYLPHLVQENAVINASTLYKTAINEELKRRLKIGPLIIQRDDRLKLMKLLAIWMYNNDKLLIHYDEIPDLLKLKDHFDLRTRLDIEYHLNDFLTCSFLNRDTAGNYRFSHKSLVDFLVAWKFADDINANLSYDFSQKPITFEVVQFIKNFDVSVKRLYDWISSTRNRFAQDVKFLGGNSVTVLNELGQKFLIERFDFSRTNIDGAKFDGQDLAGLKFFGASLKNASLDNTSLVGTDFSQADLTGINFQKLGPVYAVAFSPTGAELAAAGYYDKIKIWSVANRQELATMAGHKGSVLCIAFSKDGRYLATGGSDKEIIVYGAEKLNELTRLKDHLNEVRGIVFSPDSKYLASAGYDGLLNIWDMYNFKLVKRLYGHKDRILCLAFSPDGKYLATGSNDKSVIVWDARKFYDIARLAPLQSSVKCIAFSPDSKYLVMAGLENAMTVWNIVDRTESRFSASAESVSCMSFSPDGKYLATAGQDGNIVIWDTANSFTEITKLMGHQRCVNCICFSSNGKFLASSGQDETVKLWVADKNSENFGQPFFTFAKPIACTGMIVDNAIMPFETELLLRYNGAIKRDKRKGNNRWDESIARYIGNDSQR